MKSTRAFLLLSLAATSVAVAVTPYLSGTTGVARAAGGAAPSGSAAVQDPPSVPTLVPMRESFKWGMTHVEVITALNKLGGIIDMDYDPLLKKTQPGVQMQALEADRDNKKAAIERSYIRFVSPTGYDATGLKPEYTYGNNESILFVERQGKRRYFFFMGVEPGERLWKIYDEIPLKASGPLGPTYQEAVTRLQGALGVAGRVRAADPEHGVDYTTVDWQDGATHLRAVDRTGQKVVGVVLEERATVNALPQLRSHHTDDPMAMDPSIAAITRGTISDPNNKPAASASASAKAPKKKP